MSSVKSIVELATTQFYNDVQKILKGCISQIGTDLTVKLATDPTVRSHFACLQSSLGVFADGMQQNVIEKVVKSAKARCQEHLTGDLIRAKCIRASLKDCDVEIASDEESRSIEDLVSIIKNLERDLALREQSINSLKEDLAKEKLHRKQEAQTRDEETSKQRKRKSKNKASNLPANRFCKNVMRDFQKEGIWSYAARSHGNLNSPSRAKFDEAIVLRIYDEKLKLRDALELPVESTSDFKQSFIDILEKCHEDFDHPVVHNGNDVVTLLDVAKEFNIFWAKREVEMQANAKSSETESDTGPLGKRNKSDHQSGRGGKMPNRDRDRSLSTKQCSPSLDERTNNSSLVQLMDLLCSDGESDVDVDHDEITKMIDLWTTKPRNTPA